MWVRETPHEPAEGRAMGTELPPQRREKKGPSISPAEGAADAERRLGRPCYFSGQMVEGVFQCISCRFQIMNRKTLPACPDCGELIWAYMQDGPRPIPAGETAPPPGTIAAPPKVQDGVKLEAPAAPVRVQENVKLEP
jgi:hypothetical protein